MPPLLRLRQLVPLAAWLALASVAGAQSPCGEVPLPKLNDVRTGVISPDDCKFPIGGEMRLADRYAVQIKEAGVLTVRATSTDKRLRVCVTETTGGCSYPSIDLRGPGNHTFYVSSEAQTTGPYRLALSFLPAEKDKPALPASRTKPPLPPPRPCPAPAPVELNSYWRNSFADACVQPGGSSRTLSYSFQLKEKGPVIVELEPLAGDSARVQIELTCGKEFAGEARRLFREMGPGPCELALRAFGSWQGEFRLRLLGDCSSQTTAEAGQPYGGEFTPANCRRLEAIPGRTERFFGRMYRLDLTQRSHCFVDLASSGFKPHLLLLDQNLGVVQEANSRLEAVLPKGRHRFWAEAAPDNATGAYTFRAQCRLAPPCEWRQLKPGESKTDRFAGGDCTANDFTNGSGGERLAHAYQLVAGQTPVKVTLESGDAALLSAAGKPLPNTVRATVPGKYEFLVVANRGGVEYRLQAALEAPRIPDALAVQLVGAVAPANTVCVVTGLEPAGEAAARSFRTTDCRLGEQGPFVHLYRVTLPGRGVYAAKLPQSSFTPCLSLYGGSGRIGPIGPAITQTLDAGEYVVAVASCSLSLGKYTLATGFRPAQ